MEWMIPNPVCHKDRRFEPGFLLYLSDISSGCIREVFGMCSGRLREFPKDSRRNHEVIPATSRRHIKRIPKINPGHLKKRQRTIRSTNYLTRHQYFLSCALTLSAFYRNYWKVLFPTPF